MPVTFSSFLLRLSIFTSSANRFFIINNNSLNCLRSDNAGIYLVNASIPIEGKKDYDPRRSRKLLLHKNQIVSITTKTKAKRLTLVPTKVYTKGRLVKAEIALAKSKKKFEKKQILKKKDIEREIEQQLKGTT